jgi:elongation factor P hydroxylase
MKTYVVKLDSQDENGDSQFIEMEVKEASKDLALIKAINYFYKEYWTNTEWKKEELEKEMVSFKKKINDLSDSVFLKRLPNKHVIINEYESDLRRYLGATDKSLEEFSKLQLNAKIDYLYDIGCNLRYFVYPKKTKFEKLTIN